MNKSSRMFRKAEEIAKKGTGGSARIESACEIWVKKWPLDGMTNERIGNNIGIGMRKWLRRRATERHFKSEEYREVGSRRFNVAGNEVGREEKDRISLLKMRAVFPASLWQLVIVTGRLRNGARRSNFMCPRTNERPCLLHARQRATRVGVDLSRLSLACVAS